MSYDIELVDPVTRQCLELDHPHQMKGGTYCLGGTRYAELNITYNYSRFFLSTIDPENGIRFIYGKSGAESIPILEAAIAQLNDETDPDYWKATEGNAKQALIQLLALAKIRPDGIWDGD